MRTYEFEIYYKTEGEGEYKGAKVEATDLLLAIRAVPGYAGADYFGECEWVCPEYEKDVLEHIGAGDHGKWVSCEEVGTGRFIKEINSVRTERGLRERRSRLKATNLEGGVL